MSNDITMCDNVTCVKQENCYRFNAIVNTHQWFAYYEPIVNKEDNFSCGHYWPLERVKT